jgi:hypothetical protein
VGKRLSDMFPAKNGFKQGDSSSLLLSNFALELTIKMLYTLINLVTP